jgi:hypothetical protein
LEVLNNQSKPFDLLFGVNLEATTGFEPVIRVLQTLALPLGHVAILEQDKQLIVACLRKSGQRDSNS